MNKEKVNLTEKQIKDILSLKNLKHQEGDVFFLTFEETKGKEFLVVGHKDFFSNDITSIRIVEREGLTTIKLMDYAIEIEKLLEEELHLIVNALG